MKYLKSFENKDYYPDIIEIIEKYYTKYYVYPLNALFSPDPVNVEYENKMGSDIKYINIENIKNNIYDERIEIYKDKIITIRDYFFVLTQSISKEEFIEKITSDTKDKMFFESIGGIKNYKIKKVNK